MKVRPVLTVLATGSLVAFATGCGSSTYNVTVTCKSPQQVTTTTEYGRLNLAGHTLGRAFRYDASGEIVHMEDLKPAQGIADERIAEKITVSLDRSFETTAGADVPNSVKIEVDAQLKANLKIDLEKAARQTAPGVNFLDWVNNKDGTLERLRGNMGSAKELYVVNQLVKADRMQLRYGNDALAAISVKVIQIASGQVRAHFQCSNVIDMAGAAPFYLVQTFNYDGTKFEAAK